MRTLIIFSLLPFYRIDQLNSKNMPQGQESFMFLIETKQDYHKLPCLIFKF